MSQLKVGERFSHYTILSRLGRGGMGEVYLAEDQALGRQVALKIVAPEVAGNPAALARFRQEARLLASVQHHSVVMVFAVEEEKGIHFLTMEYVSGKPLNELIPESGLPGQELLRIGGAIAEALAAIHAKGIVHRDLKPSNVLMTDSGRPKVSDFGLAERSALAWPQLHDSPTLPETPSGAVLGTLQYSAPEQLRGENVGPAADVFSFGCLMYHASTGRPPFVAPSAVEVISAVMRDQPVPLRSLREDLSDAFVSWIERCLGKNPSERFADGGELLDAFRRIAESTAASTRRQTDDNLIQRREYRSVAVLPFEDMSLEKDQGYLCDGIADEIIGALASIPGLKVASRTSSFAVKGSTLDIAAIGRRLNVETVLEGTVKKVGQRLRISARLTEVAGGFLLWNQRFERQLEDVFAIQDDIAACALQCLGGVLSGQGEKLSRATHPTRFEAYDLYLRGRDLLRQLVDFEKAYGLFRQALEIDPNYAPAYTGIAEVLLWQGQWFGRRDEVVEEAEEAANKALELAPNLAEAHVARGHALSLTRRFVESEEEFQKAIELNEQLFEGHYFLARSRFIRGDNEGAAASYRRASEVDPLDFQAPLLLSTVYQKMGLAKEYREALEKGIRLAERHLELQPHGARALVLGGIALLQHGKKDKALAWIERAAQVSPDEGSTLYNLVCFYCLVGDKERALEFLEKLVDLGFGFREWLEQDPDLDAIRNEPRFHEIVSRIPH